MPNLIQQNDLRNILDLREDVMVGWREFSGYLARLEIAEDSLLRQLKKKHKVEKGKHTAEIEIQTRRNVKWRQVCEMKLGKGFVKQTTKGTEPTLYHKLKVDGKVFTKSEKKDED